MIDLEELISTLAKLALDQAPLTEAIVFQRLGLDISSARVLRVKTGEVFTTNGARRLSDNAQMDVLVSFDPNRDVGVLFHDPLPKVSELDAEPFQINRRTDMSGSENGFNIHFNYGGAMIGVGVSKLTKEVSIISAEPMPP